MTFQSEKQSISASRLLQALADGDDIQLSQCVITGVLDINRLFDPAEKFQIDKLRFEQRDTTKKVFFEQAIVFDKCVFEENLVFAGPWAEPESISVEFKADVIFNSSQFKAQTRFRNAVFHCTAGFDGCTFVGVATFKNALIHGEAKFRTTVFNGYSLFGNIQFNSSARFTNTHFVKGVNFAGANFMGHADFNGVYSSSRAVPAFEEIHFAGKRHGEDESFWRFVKQSALEAGYYQLAGECFYNERCSRLWAKLFGLGYDALSPLKKFLKQLAGLRLLPELIFGRMLFGYGERPVRVLFASALIIFICAFFYSLPDALVYRAGEMENTSFFQGLYFSTITFTTLGYGDLYPAQDSAIRLLAMFEAVAGGCLMALFVVCMAKRFSRG
jgi:hypothetical protein